MSDVKTFKKYLTSAWDRAVNYYHRASEVDDLDPDNDEIKLPHGKKRRRIDRDHLRFQQKEVKRQQDILYWKDVIAKLGDRDPKDPELRKATNELRTLEQRTRKSAIKGIQGKSTKPPVTSSEEAKLKRGKKPVEKYRGITEHLRFDPNNGVEIA